MTTLYETMGLLGPADLEAVRWRAREAFAGPLGPPGNPLEQAMGLPGPVSRGRGRFGRGIEGGAATPLIEEDSDGRWWPWVAALLVGTVVYEALDHPIEMSEDLDFELPGWELDGIPWTVDVLHTPGPQYAARVGEPMLHGGMALPGPGSTNVNIGGRGALTVQHAVAACPQTNVVGLPHIPQAGSWKTTNGSVFVNGAPLLRAGDWIFEHFGGCNPLIGGAPTVKAGPPARPCITQEVRYLSLPGPLERIGSKGTRIKVTGSARWNLRSMLAAGAAGGVMVATGGSPLGRWGAGLILKNTEPPSIEMELEGTSEHYADLRGDLDGDGEDERARVRMKNECSAKQSAEFDPENPRNAEAGDLETDCETPDFDIEFPDEDER